MVDIRERFEAAVNVIQSLPKSGSFQPSNELMLKFYGYYKQAKEGPCRDPKPSFWDVVRKAKWEAWSKLGDTSKEEAMNSYVHQLKEVIQNMPETDTASEFVYALEPFYKIAYKNGEVVPPIFNMFNKKQNNYVPSCKINGHATLVKDNTHKLSKHNTSHEPTIQEMKSHTTNGKVENNHDRTESNITSNDVDKEVTSNFPVDLKVKTSTHNGDSSHQKDHSEDDDDDLFCDSLGPESIEEILLNDQEDNGNSFVADSAPDDIIQLKDRNRSSISDVEVLEQFNHKKNGSDDSSSHHSDKIVHVHFKDLELSQEAKDCSLSDIPVKHKIKECVVQPGHREGSSSGVDDCRSVSRGLTSGGKHTQRNAQYSERSVMRYEQRYRRRSQESDSDESPARSDPNSSSEKDEMAIDKIAELLIQIKEDMKKILDRLKRLEVSIQQTRWSWLQDYQPSKAFVFLLLWPFVVNFLFNFLRRRLSKKYTK